MACALILLAFGCRAFGAGALQSCDSSLPLDIPGEKINGERRNITVDDVVALRVVDSMRLSPDGEKYAVLIRQADSDLNEYRTGWFVGHIPSRTLVYAGAGGCARPSVTSVGFSGGQIEGNEVRWTPDNQWIVYAKSSGADIQLWSSSADGKIQQQLTNNLGDVYEFEVSVDGNVVYYLVGAAREQHVAAELKRRREGYNYNEDIYTFSNLMSSQLTRPRESNLSLWKIDLSRKVEQLGSLLDRKTFDALRKRQTTSDDSDQQFYAKNGPASAWARQKKDGRFQLFARLDQSHEKEIPCEFEECSGAIRAIGWLGFELVYWRGEGIDDSANAFYAWEPSSSRIRRLWHSLDDELQLCQFSSLNSAVCVRETKSRSSHIAAIRLSDGEVEVLSDINPEIGKRNLGVIERIEWEIPSIAWNQPGGALEALYPTKAYGYILYPPEFDPSKKYPVFIDPYVAHGFEPSVGGEHPLHVYAANGFVVLNLAFPWPDAAAVERLGIGSRLMETLYSEKLGFPHLNIQARSTLAGLRAAIVRGIVDEDRIGIGGVSHGTFVPLHLAWKHGGLAAISISSPIWGPHEYYWATNKQREVELKEWGSDTALNWKLKPEGSGREYWRQIDPSDHVEDIRAPILMQLADQETYALLRLIRHLDDAGKPYDVYVFREENHIKWQPAHIKAVQQRNLDWFRFWLQDVEDPNPEKDAQYERWRNLRRVQCENSRSMRTYCDVSRAHRSLLN